MYSEKQFRGLDFLGRPNSPKPISVQLFGDNTVRHRTPHQLPLLGEHKLQAHELDNMCARRVLFQLEGKIELTNN